MIELFKVKLNCAVAAAACGKDRCKSFKGFIKINLNIIFYGKRTYSADGMTDKLAKAFITPIEREDIGLLSTNIDTLTDKLEEVCMRVYIHNVQTIRPDALTMLDAVIRGCEEVGKMLGEFADFRHSKKLKEYIIHINSIEEECDRLFIANMHKLHVEPLDVRDVMAWEEIYTYLEKCADACEEIADTVESVVMKNS